MKAFLNQKPYFGGIRDIALRKHTTITIEIGAPVKAPQTHNFGGL